MDQVNELSTSYTTVTFYDQNGNLATPDSATYTIFNVSTGQQVLPTTVITGLASSVTLTVTAVQNTLSDRTNAQEIRRIQVISHYGASQLDSAYEYAVVNLTYGDQ